MSHCFSGPVNYHPYLTHPLVGIRWNLQYQTSIFVIYQSIKILYFTYFTKVFSGPLSTLRNLSNNFADLLVQGLKLTKISKPIFYSIKYKPDEHDL